MPNPSQEPPRSSKATNEDLKNMDLLCAFNIKLESQNLDHGCIKTSDHIKIKIKMPNYSQEPPTSPKTPIQDMKDMDFLCTVKIKKESQNLDHGCIKHQ